MRPGIKISVVAVVALSTAGCVIAVTEDGMYSGRSETGWEARQQMNRAYIHGLALGTSVQEVRQELGDPDYSEGFNGEDGEYRVYHYRTHHVRSDGKTTRDETTPVVFRDGVVVGFGQDYYLRAISP